MDLRQTLERKLQLKRKELAELELKLREHGAYIRALEDVLRTADTPDAGEPSEGEPNIRPGSDAGRTRDAIKRAGRPMHIDEILKEIGRSVEKKDRASLASTLANYVRKGAVFTRPGPNTFALVEFGAQPTLPIIPKPPEDFGSWDDTPPTADDDVPR